jgi:hypothetical protein
MLHKSGRCDFCGKTHEAAGVLAGGPNTFICEECVRNFDDEFAQMHNKSHSNASHIKEPIISFSGTVRRFQAEEAIVGALRALAQEFANVRAQYRFYTFRIKSPIPDLILDLSSETAPNVGDKNTSTGP